MPSTIYTAIVLLFTAFRFEKPNNRTQIALHCNYNLRLITVTNIPILLYYILNIITTT